MLNKSLKSTFALLKPHYQPSMFLDSKIYFEFEGKPEVGTIFDYNIKDDFIAVSNREGFIIMGSFYEFLKYNQKAKIRRQLLNQYPGDES